MDKNYHFIRSIYTIPRKPWYNIETRSDILLQELLFYSREIAVNELEILSNTNPTQQFEKNERIIVDYKERKARRLLYLFQRDFLGSMLGNQILENKTIRDAFYFNWSHYYDYIQYYNGKAISSETLVWFIAFYSIMVIFMIGYILYFAFLQTYQIQKAWISSLLIYFLLDFLILSNLDVLVIHVGMPSIIADDMKIIRNYILAFVERQINNLKMEEDKQPDMKYAERIITTDSPYNVRPNQKVAMKMKGISKFIMASKNKKKNISNNDLESPSSLSGIALSPKPTPQQQHRTPRKGIFPFKRNNTISPAPINLSSGSKDQISPSFATPNLKNNYKNRANLTVSPPTAILEQKLKTINSIHYFFVSYRIAQYFLDTLECNLVSLFHENFLPGSFLPESWLLRSHLLRIHSKTYKQNRIENYNLLKLRKEITAANGKEEAEEENGASESEKVSNRQISEKRKPEELTFQNNTPGSTNVPNSVLQRKNLYHEHLSVFTTRGFYLFLSYCLTWFLIKPYHIQDMLVQMMNAVIVLGLLWIHYYLYLMSPYYLVIPFGIVFFFVGLSYFLRGCQGLIHTMRRKYGRSLIHENRMKERQRQQIDIEDIELQPVSPRKSMRRFLSSDNILKTVVSNRNLEIQTNEGDLVYDFNYDDLPSVKKRRKAFEEEFKSDDEDEEKKNDNKNNKNSNKNNKNEPKPRFDKILKIKKLRYQGAFKNNNNVNNNNTNNNKVVATSPSKQSSWKRYNEGENDEEDEDDSGSGYDEIEDDFLSNQSKILRRSHSSQRMTTVVSKSGKNRIIVNNSNKNESQKGSQQTSSSQVEEKNNKPRPPPQQQNKKNMKNNMNDQQQDQGEDQESLKEEFEEWKKGRQREKILNRLQLIRRNPRTNNSNASMSSNDQQEDDDDDNNSLYNGSSSSLSPQKRVNNSTTTTTTSNYRNPTTTMNSNNNNNNTTTRTNNNSNNTNNNNNNTNRGARSSQQQEFQQPRRVGVNRK
jgi:hypothetical protein